MELASRDRYKHWTPVTIRYCDQDAMGHVNNATYAEWFEASRVMLINDLFKDQTRLSTVLARMTIDYLNETHFPGTVEVGGRMSRVGNKSFESSYGVFRDGVCLATAVCVNVFFDLQTRRSAEPPEAVRAMLNGALEA